MQSRIGSFSKLEEAQVQNHPIRFTNQPNNRSSSHLPLKLLTIFLFLLASIFFIYITAFAIRYVNVHTTTPVSQPRTEQCDQESKNLDRWIRPSSRSTLWHEMNDTELFWRASFAPLIKEYPFKRVEKIAFMFLTRGPLPMAPLWDRFFKGNEELYSIYVHSSPSYQPDFTASSAFYGRQIPSQLTEWGMMSMCDAERRLLANALLDFSNEYFVLLSEACIPLQNFTTIYTYISESRHSFIGSFDDPGPTGRGRYNDNLSPAVNLTEWRKGSQWFETNRKLALDIVRDIDYYPKFERFCRPECYVDEHYFPTMLSIQSPRLLANRSLTWVDWSRGGPHPATFGESEVTDELFEDMNGGDEKCLYNDRVVDLCFLFARKFDPSALDRLLEYSFEFFGF